MENYAVGKETRKKMKPPWSHENLPLEKKKTKKKIKLTDGLLSKKNLPMEKSEKKTN